MCCEAVEYHKFPAKFLRAREVLPQLRAIVISCPVVRGEYFLLCRTSTVYVRPYNLAFRYLSKTQPVPTVCRENGSLGALPFPLRASQQPCRTCCSSFAASAQRQAVQPRFVLFRLPYS